MPQVLYEHYAEVTLVHPYISGFLAFREVPHLMVLVNQLKQTHPHLVPDMILVALWPQYDLGALNTLHIIYTHHMVWGSICRALTPSLRVYRWTVMVCCTLVASG